MPQPKECIAWNKGLTKNDIRVKINVERMTKTRHEKNNWKVNSGTFEKGQTRAHYPKGRKNPKLSEIRKRMFQKGELNVSGKNNPMYNKKANKNQLRALLISVGRTGNKCNFWKGGITPKSRLIRTSKIYKQWRGGIFKRDNYTCQKCGKRGCYIEAHHIKNFSDYPDLRFDINNGITMCKNCHNKTKNGNPLLAKNL